MFQSEKVGLERECRAKDEQLAVREAEVEQIPALRNELEKLRVRMSEILTCSKLSPSLPRLPHLPHPLLSLSHYRQRRVVWRRYVKGRMRWWL